MLEYIKDQSSFAPNEISAMAEAFAATCNDLHVFAGDQHGREVIAGRIIDLARAGIKDPVTLRQRVVRESRSPLSDDDRRQHEPLRSRFG